MPGINGNPEFIVFFLEKKGDWAKMGFKLERAAKRFMAKNHGSFLKRFCVISSDGSTKYVYDTQTEAQKKAREIGGQVSLVAPPKHYTGTNYYA